MKGCNKLLINQATMIEAIQFWIDNEMDNPVVVTKVSTVASSFDADEFEIKLETKEEQTDKRPKT